MNAELLKTLEKENPEKLFYYFKHDGALNFEKKLLAGKLLKNKGYDALKLSQEKEIIVNSILVDLRKGEDHGFLEKKCKKEMNKSAYFWLGFMAIFLIMEIKAFWFNQEGINRESLLIVLFSGGLYFTYFVLTYKKSLNKLLEAGRKNNELLRHRLSIINEEWDF